MRGGDGRSCEIVRDRGRWHLGEEELQRLRHGHERREVVVGGVLVVGGVAEVKGAHDQSGDEASQLDLRVWGWGRGEGK